MTLTGTLTQITRNTTAAADPQYSSDGASVQFRIGHDWFSWNRAERLVAPLALPRAMKDPAADADEDYLRALQLRLISTLKRQKDDRDAGRAAPPVDVVRMEAHVLVVSISSGRRTASSTTPTTAVVAAAPVALWAVLAVIS